MIFQMKMKTLKMRLKINYRISISIKMRDFKRIILMNKMGSCRILNLKVFKISFSKTCNLGQSLGGRIISF
jgi:hypothetical protein